MVDCTVESKRRAMAGSSGGRRKQPAPTDDIHDIIDLLASSVAQEGTFRPTKQPKETVQFRARIDCCRSETPKLSLVNLNLTVPPAHAAGTHAQTGGNDVTAQKGATMVRNAVSSKSAVLRSQKLQQLKRKHAGGTEEGTRTDDQDEIWAKSHGRHEGQAKKAIKNQSPADSPQCSHTASVSVTPRKTSVPQRHFSPVQVPVQCLPDAVAVPLDKDAEADAQEVVESNIPSHSGMASLVSHFRTVPPRPRLRRNPLPGPVPAGTADPAVVPVEKAPSRTPLQSTAAETADCTVIVPTHQPPGIGGVPCTQPVNTTIRGSDRQRAAPAGAVTVHTQTQLLTRPPRCSSRSAYQKPKPAAAAAPAPSAPAKNRSRGSHQPAPACPALCASASQCEQSASPQVVQPTEHCTSIATAALVHKPADDNMLPDSRKSSTESRCSTSQITASGPHRADHCGDLSPRCLDADQDGSDDDPISQLLQRCHRVLDKPKPGSIPSAKSPPTGSLLTTSEHAVHDWRQRLHRLLGDKAVAGPLPPPVQSSSASGLHDRDPLQEWRATRAYAHGLNQPSAIKLAGDPTSTPVQHALPSATAVDLRRRLHVLLHCGDDAVPASDPCGPPPVVMHEHPGAEQTPKATAAAGRQESDPSVLGFDVCGCSDHAVTDTAHPDLRDANLHHRRSPALLVTNTNSEAMEHSTRSLDERGSARMAATPSPPQEGSDSGAAGLLAGDRTAPMKKAWHCGDNQTAVAPEFTTLCSDGVEDSPPVVSRMMSPACQYATLRPSCGETPPAAMPQQPADVAERAAQSPEMLSGGSSPRASSCMDRRAPGSMACSQASLRSEQGLADAVDAILHDVFHSDSGSPSCSVRSSGDGSCVACDHPLGVEMDRQAQGGCGGDTEGHDPDIASGPIQQSGKICEVRLQLGPPDAPKLPHGTMHTGNSHTAAPPSTATTIIPQHSSANEDTEKGTVSFPGTAQAASAHAPPICDGPAGVTHTTRATEAQPHARQPQSTCGAACAEAHGPGPRHSADQCLIGDGRECMPAALGHAAPPCAQPQSGVPWQDAASLCTSEQRAAPKGCELAAKHSNAVSCEQFQSAMPETSAGQWSAGGGGCPWEASIRCLHMDGVAVVRDGSQSASSSGGGSCGSLGPDGRAGAVKRVGCEPQRPGHAAAAPRSTVGAPCSTADEAARPTAPGLGTVGATGTHETAAQHQDVLQAMEALELCSAGQAPRSSSPNQTPGGPVLPAQRSERFSFFPGFSAFIPPSELSRAQGQSAGSASLQIASLDGWLPCTRPPHWEPKLRPISDSLPLPGSDADRVTGEQRMVLGHCMEVEDAGLQELFRQEQMLGLQSAPEDAGVLQCWERIMKVSSLLESPEPTTL
eukprot:jgi/Ulvmu1/4767/UM020_0052.1